MQLAPTPRGIVLPHGLDVGGVQHFQDLVPPLLYDTVGHTALVQQGTERQQVFLDIHA